MTSLKPKPMTREAVPVSSDLLYDNMIASAVDERCHNIRFRQNQLRLLHAFLQKNIESICHAIREDSDNAELEALTEFCFTIASITQLYEQLDFDGTLENEYSISSNKNHNQRRVPHGIVLIRPQNYSRFFSILAPLAAALAAGNCVVVELPHILKKIDEYIKSAVAVLDHDTFTVTTCPITDEDFLSQCFLVDQTTGTGRSDGSTFHNQSPMSIAVVHRNADIEKAARSLCTSCFRFQGQSPFAPGIVLVNEWVKKNFIQACLQIMVEETAAFVTSDDISDMVRASSRDHDLIDRDEFNTLYSSSHIQFLEMKQREMMSTQKIPGGRSLVILSVTSLTDAISLAAQIPSINALYAFSGLSDAKFISQQVHSAVTFVNHIPIHLLIGPVVGPSMSDSHPELRYNTTMMSKPHPEYVHAPTGGCHQLVTQLLASDRRATAKTAETVEKLKMQALAPLKPTGQASGSSMGFFDQGILTGVVAFVLPVVCLTGVAVFAAGRFALRQIF